MNEKKAFVNAVFGTMEAIDGAKKVNKAYKEPNKYDDLMGTKLVKTPKVMGAQNAMVSKKTAAEELDFLCKQAGVIGKHDLAIAKQMTKGAVKNIPNVANKMKGAIDTFDAKNTEHLVNAAKAFGNKQFMNGLHHTVKAAPGTLLGAGLIAGSGIGTSKLLKKLDGKDNPKNNIEYDTIGAAISAGMALNALSSGRMLSPATKALGILGSQAVKVPANTAKNTPVGKAVNIVGQGVKATSAKANTINKDINFIGSKIDQLMNNGRTFEQAKQLIIDQQIGNLKNQNWQLGKTNPDKLQSMIDGRIAELGHTFDVVGNLINKKASEELDELCKLAGARADYLQGVVKDRFFKPGLESIPYYAGTSLMGLMVDQKVKKRLKDAELYKAHQQYLKGKENQPQKQQEKVASSEAIFFKNPKVNDVFKKSLESAVEGAGRMAIPIAASTIIGRDLTNSFKKVDRTETGVDGSSAPDEASIQLSRRQRKQMMKDISSSKQVKSASEEVAEKDETIEEIVREIEREIIGAKDKLQGEKVHIGPGVKKTFRMNPSHGMHGMTE